MAAIHIKDLEINEALDKQALENILGGRWVRKTFYRRIVKRYTRRFVQRIRVISYRYRSFYKTYTRVFYQQYTKWVWV